MKNKRMYKMISFVIMFCVILHTPISIFAADKASLNSEKSNLQEKIDENTEKIEEIDREKSAVMKEVENLIYEISNYEAEISALNGEISSLKNKISEAEVQLAQEQKNYEKLDADMKDRLVVIYENGETSFLDILLGSKDLVDLISNYYLATEIAKADTEMLDEIEKKKVEIEETKKGLENNKKELEIKKENEQRANNALIEAKNIKNQKAAALSASERELEAEIEEYERQKKQIDAQLKRIAEEEEARRRAAASAGQQTVTKVTTPSASGYIHPIPGYSITTGLYYSSGKYHGAVDFSGYNISGKNVLAVKAGTVVTSTALISNGRYYSYGEYIVINHHDGTMTLYAHGQPGSRKVSVGDTVYQGQTIMNVGTTGNSTGPHLHFEVRVNGTRVDPRPYLP